MINKSQRYGLLSAVLLVILMTLALLFLRFRPFIVLSGSMEPAIRKGSIVFTDIGNRSPEKDEIITVLIGNTFVTHRFCRMENGQVITKGDANKTEDFIPVPKEKIVGVVTFIIPCFGYLLLFVRKTWYVGLPAFLCLYCLLSRKERKKEK